MLIEKIFFKTEEKIEKTFREDRFAALVYSLVSL